MMTDSPAAVDDSRLLRFNLVWVGVAAAVVYWFAESLLHAFYWDTGSFLATFCAQSRDDELSMRLVTVGMMLGVGFVGETVKHRYQGLLQKQLQHNRLMRFLSDCNQRVQRNTAADELFQAACKGAVEIGEFRFAWIGMVEDGHCKLVAWAAADQALADRIDRFQGASILIRCLGCRQVLKEGVNVVCDIQSRVDCAAPWRDDFIRLNVLQALAMPLKVGQETVGVFEVYAGKDGAIDETEYAILDEVADDVSQTLQNIRREAERNQLMQDMRHRVEELERFQRATIDREFRIKELRDEIAALKDEKP